MNSINFEIINVLENISSIEGFVEQALDKLSINSNLSFKVQLCLDELLTNIIKYGYGENINDTISIKFYKMLNSLFIMISDQGNEFNPLTAKIPDINSPLEKREIGGLGVHFVKEMTKSQVYERKNGKNIFTIEFETT
jgi:anti-sigma regulatory factor (Ser/Thr protein kinase)